jgi:flagellar biosynthetic protein FliR
MLPVFAPQHTVEGLLIFIRVLGIFTSAPVFGHAHLPPQVKIALAAMISLILVPILPLPDPRLADNLLLLAAAGIKEAVVGVILGFVATMIFMAIQLAGEAADVQVGFGLANIADPLFGSHTSIIGQFQYMMATLLFLAMDGHHLILTGLIQSFHTVPLGGFTLQPLLTGRVLSLLGDLFMVGLRIGGPVMLAVFLTDLAMGLLGRTVPQMNLMAVGFPVKVAVGFGILLVSLPVFILLCQGLFTGMYHDLLLILQAM